MIIHAYSFKDWKVLHYDSVSLLKAIILVGSFSSLSLKDEELVLLLLSHDQILSTDNGNPILISGFDESNDLVWLSCLCLKKGDWNLSALVIVLIVQHDDLVNLGDEHKV